MFSLMFTLLALEPGYHKLRTFEAFPEGNEEYLSSPSCFVFTPEGHLYLVDSATSRIHKWSKTGSYVKSFGALGQGPGESQFPDRADFKDGTLYVLDGARTMTRYDSEGKYLSSFKLLKPRLRNFSVINEHLFLLTSREQVSGTEIYNRIELVDDEGNLVKLLERFRNNSFVTPRHGNNIAKVKAFPPAVDIQKGAGETWYFGFSQNQNVYSIDASGRPIGKIKMQIPTDKCSDEEIKMYKELAIPCAGGGSFILKDMKTVSTDFSSPKAYYSKFSVQEDEIVFSRTPDGGVFSCEGYPAGEYIICDLKTGKPRESGRFDLGDGSFLFFRDKHILAILNKDDLFEVAEIRFGKKI